MARKVYAYQSIASLAEHPCYDEIKSSPNIAATAYMTNALRARYAFPFIMCMRVVQKRLSAGWEEDSLLFQQYLNISAVIRKMKVPSEDMLLHQSFVKNKKSLVNSIRFLAEAGFTPDQLNPSNAEERIFKDVWQGLENTDPSFAAFRKEMDSLSDPKKLMQQMKSFSPMFESKKIVLHGFYYITPIQERIFDLLEQCGYTLIFLCCADRETPGIDEIWYQAFSEEKGFPPSDEWIYAEEKETLGRAFGKTFSGDVCQSAIDNVSVIKYKSEMDFVTDTQRLIDEGYELYCVDDALINDLLKEFYPEQFNRRHLLAYPVGQYIYRLHAMWNSQHQQLELTMDDVHACFASGWVSANGKNASEYVKELEKIREYVSDCRSLEEWEDRLNDLQIIQKYAVAKFDEKIVAAVPPERQRWHRICGNPLCNFSEFSVSGETLNDLADMIRQLIHTARELFSKNREVVIADHLAKIRQLLSAHKDEKLLLAEEKVIIEELNSRLQFNNLGLEKCMPGELSEAIMIIIGGGILDETQNRITADEEESFARLFLDVEAAPLLDKKIHLCFADETNLPGKKKGYTWPLTAELVVRMIEENASLKCAKYLSNLWFINENAALSNRYLFASMLQNPYVEISWVAADEEKEIGPSPYVQMLTSLFGVKETEYEKQEIRADAVNKISAENANVYFDINLYDDTPSEVKMDAILCPRRYLYGYVLSDHPYYYTKFHHSFAISNLIAALAKVSGMPQHEVADEVFKLFPYLKDIEKQQIYDHIPHSVADGTYAFEDVSYPESRLAVHYLQKSIAEDAEKRYSELIEESGGELPSDSKKTAINCSLCPYETFCSQVNKVQGDGHD